MVVKTSSVPEFACFPFPSTAPFLLCGKLKSLVATLLLGLICHSGCLFRLNSDGTDVPIYKQFLKEIKLRFVLYCIEQ